jgi:hypothetical protein
VLELAPPYAPARLSTVDTRRLWRLDEATASSAATDLAPSPENLAANGNPGVGPGLFAGGAVGSRTFDGSTQWLADSGLGIDQIVLTGGNWTLEGWFVVDALGAIRTLAEYGHDATVTARTTLANIHVTAAGAIAARWQDAALDTYSVISADGAVIAGQVHHVALVVRRTATSTWDVELWLDGELVASVGNEVPAGGGTVSRWYLGASPSAGASLTAPAQRLDGSLDDWRLSTFPATRQCIRETIARAQRSWDLATLIESKAYTVHRWLITEDAAGNEVDLTDLAERNWLKSGRVEETVDDMTATMSVQLQRNSYDVSLAPLVAGSPLNTGSAVLAPMRPIRLEVSIVPQGLPRAAVGFDRHVLFEGWTRRITWPAEEIGLECIGKMRSLQITWVRPAGVGDNEDHVFGTDVGRALQLVVQDVIDACEPAAGYKGGRPVLRVVDDPAYNVRPRFLVPPTRSVAQVIDDLVTELTGWWLKDWWDEHRQEWRLSLIEPPRTATWTSGDAVIDPGDTFDIGAMDLDDEIVRNVVEVEVTDRAATDRTGSEVRATVIDDDPASVAAFGERYCRLSLESESQLNDLAQAAALNANVLHDLKAPRVATSRKVPFRWHHQLGDIVRLQPDGRRDDTTRDYGLVGLSYAFSATEQWTELDLREQVAGKLWRWFDYVVQEGAIPGRGLTPVEQPSSVIAEAVANGIKVSWDLPVNNRNRRYRETEIHVSPTNGFTPSDTTLVGVVRGLSSATIDPTLIPPGVTRYVKLAHRDEMNNVSAISAQVSAVARQTTIKGWATARRSTSDQALSSGDAFQTVIFNGGEVDPLSRYNATTGELTTLTAGLLAVSAQVLYDTNNKPGSVAILGIFVDGVQVFEGAAVITAGTPDRGTPRIAATIRVDAGDVVTVRISGTGNAGHEVVNSASTWVTFDPTAED